MATSGSYQLNSNNTYINALEKIAANDALADKLQQAKGHEAKLKVLAEAGIPTPTEADVKQVERLYDLLHRRVLTDTLWG
ncbi:MAG TPA: Nif11-like leader peptide family natural product precursor [Acidimicrobiales bacterium]|jgi:hypothetical protein|nr:Nif11-like leader peptide family natural product precursor [Acidimicrobiales bacterium]